MHLHLCFPGCVIGAGELGYERVVGGRWVRVRHRGFFGCDKRGLLVDCGWGRVGIYISELVLSLAPLLLSARAKCRSVTVEITVRGYKEVFTGRITCGIEP